MHNIKPVSSDRADSGQDRQTKTLTEPTRENIPDNPDK